MILTNRRSGVNFDIEPNEITRPNGRENISVNVNRRSVVRNPPNKIKETFQKFKLLP
jgi:hypothetical protein